MAKIDDSVKKKVPELRFSGFTDDWEERKLGELGSVAMNRRIFKDQTSENEEVPFFKIGTFGSKPDAFISRELFDEYKLKYPYPEIGDILISASGSIGRTVVYQGEDEYFQDSNIVWLKHDDRLDNKFLKQFYSIVKWQGLEGSTIKRLYNKNILDTDISIPSTIEQQKIGSFFKQLDNTIALHQRKLDLLKEQKKGFLQKMFPKNGAKVPELRFAGFADDWEERKLGDTKTHFTDGNYGESYPSAKDMSDKENGVPFLRGSDFSNGYLDSSNANYIRPEKHAELTSGHIQQDDIILAVRGSLGTLGYATQENEGWNINSQLAILRTNKSEISGKFLIQYLLGSKGQKEILSRNTGTALKQLPIKQLKDIPVPVPTLEEQQKIGSFFKQLDKTIALHQRKLDLLKEQKKGFLQKMFV
ncbi:restriction endonuclease subunit S [Lactococcus sp. NH2-7C]|uniref:restriction endonuclease subunit S n=1 Tax=Lactococcus sp. NH2-7C TaxID=2879149 RepID=UPI001CDBD9EC|nr:restriction endonuclease subunit S [Lactococcus sp. NH2-7C]MCA2391200.1 restriction endonuclease subunit S [Lactococcus sp. NH2-7C]WGV31740.1 restriction endonuclease subunit S [Lactococcus sp. NH2-7C]